MVRAHMHTCTHDLGLVFKEHGQPCTRAYIHAYMHAYIQTDESLEELSLINVVLNVDAEQEVEEG